ncbi:MAG: hypothetical protein ACJ71O_01545 [Nitrososphaeraceae archaeon]
MTSTQNLHLLLPTGNLLSASISDIIEIFDLHEQIFIVKEAAAL